MRFFSLCPCVNRAEFKSLYSDSEIRWVEAAPAAGARVLRMPVVAEITGVRLGYPLVAFPEARVTRHFTRWKPDPGRRLQRGAYPWACKRRSFSALRANELPLCPSLSAAPSTIPARLHRSSISQCFKMIVYQDKVSGTCLEVGKLVFFVQWILCKFCMFCLFVSSSTLETFFLCFLFCMFVAVKLLELEISCVFSLLLRLKWNPVSWNFLLEF
jgi:hypothetical protein